MRDDKQIKHTKEVFVEKGSIEMFSSAFPGTK